MDNIDSKMNKQHFKVIRCKDTLYSFKPYGLLELSDDGYDILWNDECNYEEAKKKFCELAVQSKEIKKSRGKWYGIALIDFNNNIIAKE